MHFGKGIAIVREARSMKLIELGKLCGVSHSYISLIEKGHRVPSTETLHAIAKALDVPVYLLMLLGSNAKDLRCITEEHAGIIGRELLAVLISAEKTDAELNRNDSIERRSNVSPGAV